MAKLGSAGLALIFSDVRLVDPNGCAIVTPRLNGEVITQGPNIMKGYWNNPEATAARSILRGGFTPAISDSSMRRVFCSSQTA